MTSAQEREHPEAQEFDLQRHATDLHRDIAKALFDSVDYQRALAGQGSRRGMDNNGSLRASYSRGEGDAQEDWAVENTEGYRSPSIELSVRGSDDALQTFIVRPNGKPARGEPKPSISYQKRVRGELVINEQNTPAAAVGGRIVLDRFIAPPKLPGM